MEVSFQKKEGQPCKVQKGKNGGRVISRGNLANAPFNITLDQSTPFNSSLTVMMTRMLNLGDKHL